MFESDSSRSSRAFSLNVDERTIDEVFAHVNQCLLPGAAVGVALRGRPVYRKGFGLASIELPCALSTSTRMRIGSVSKQFTALAYLLLCEEGKAAMEDPLGKYFPDFTPVMHAITIRHLLGHTSGIRDVVDIHFRLAGFEGRPVTTRELLFRYRTIDVVPDRAADTARASAREPGCGRQTVIGAFRSPDTGRIVQLLSDGGTQIVSIDAHDLPFERDARGDLVPIPVWSHIRRRIEFLGDGIEVRKIRLVDFGDADELVRADAVTTPDVSALVGDYRAPAIESRARIFLRDDAPRLRLDSAFGSMEYSMAHVCEQSWRINAPDSVFLDALLTFSKRYDSFQLFAYSVKGLGFHRAD